MDANNVADLKQMAPVGTEHKIHLFAAESVPDPWYTGDLRRPIAGFWLAVKSGWISWQLPKSLICERIQNMKEFYETYKVYLTRKNLEIAALVVIILSALLVFFSAIPGQGVLTLE